MSTLLLRLAAPLQAWGASSKYDKVRRTERLPTKSGVIGLLMAALGCRRDDRQMIERLQSLRFGVRVDQPGALLRDYHTVRAEKPYETNRYYLSDAVFVVGLESEDDALLHELEQALGAPAFPLFLGRRSCPPTPPLVLGVQEAGLSAALHEEAWRVSEWQRKKMQRRGSTVSLEVFVETAAADGLAQRLNDSPLSFDPRHRAYAGRWQKYDGAVEVVQDNTTEHDPFAALGEEENDVSDPNGA